MASKKQLCLSLSVSVEFSAILSLDVLREAFPDCPASDNEAEWQTWLENDSAADDELAELIDFQTAIQDVDVVTVEDAELLEINVDE